MAPKPARPLERERHAASTRSLPLSAASLRLYECVAARRVQATKAREQRRPVHEGMTANGIAPSEIADMTRKDDERRAYLTWTGSLTLAGACTCRTHEGPTARYGGGGRGGAGVSVHAD